MIKKFWWIVKEEGGELVIPVGSEIIKHVNVKNGMVFSARTVNELDPIYEKIKLILPHIIDTEERLLRVYDETYEIYIFEGFDKDIVFLGTGIKLTQNDDPVEVCLILKSDTMDSFNNIPTHQDSINNSEED